MNSTANALLEAYRAFEDAAQTVSSAAEAERVAPAAGEWDAEQILAHVSLVTAATLGAVSAVAAGVNATYDNRVAQDTWTLDRLVERAGGGAGLRERIRLQAQALRALVDGAALGETELATPVPTLLVSHGKLMLDQPVPLGEIVTGLAAMEVPGHARQLLALRTDTAS
ncbi:hypothetical protein KDL01_07525 [Actinospica durhamensis]|uniref:Uncharacterized protein n=1 Tax=Actinospica durhamensis TaxID=1508375 RepID=A0A941ELJ9_9ACTN|nr:hypothetical protein [Actinospica durhamensis]MBR7833108.1 hypothetical protein [Actinospica durhamensis]